MRIFPWRCAFTSPQYFTFSLLSIQLFTFTLFFFLKLGTLFQPNDNISMLFCCHRTNLPLTLPIFLTPHFFATARVPTFVFFRHLYFFPLCISVRTAVPPARPIFVFAVGAWLLAGILNSCSPAFSTRHSHSQRATFVSAKEPQIQ